MSPREAQRRSERAAGARQAPRPPPPGTGGRARPARPASGAHASPRRAHARHARAPPRRGPARYRRASRQSSQTEDAEAVGTADVVAVDRGEGDAQDGPRVSWIDDAVVGDTARRVEGAGLALGAILNGSGKPRVLLLV